MPACTHGHDDHRCKPHHDCRDKHKEKDKHKHGGDCANHNGHGYGHQGKSHWGTPSNRSVTIHARTVAATVPSAGGNPFVWGVLLLGGCLATIAALTAAVRRRLLAR